MPTLRQKKVAKLVVENSALDQPKTGGEIVESSGYGVSMKKNPQVILNSAGVLEELNNLGFSEEGAKQVVQEIMYNEEVDANARLKATDQVFKIHGSYAPEKSVNLSVKADVKEIGELDKIRIEYEEKLKNQLIQ